MGRRDSFPGRRLTNINRAGNKTRCIIELPPLQTILVGRLALKPPQQSYWGAGDEARYIMV